MRLTIFRSRVATATAILFALQLLVQVTGLPCAISSMSRAGGNPGAMAMQMATQMPMQMATGAAHHTRSPAPGDRAPCDSPMAPTACQAMVACAPAVVAPTALALTPRAALPERPAALAVLAPPLLKTAPELPPPRA